MHLICETLSFLCSDIAPITSDTVIVLLAAYSLAFALIIGLAPARAPWVDAFVDIALVNGFIAAVITLTPVTLVAPSVASAVRAEDATVLSEDFTVRLVNGALVIRSGWGYYIIFIIRVDVVFIIIRFDVVFIVKAVVCTLALSEVVAVSVATAFRVV